jgi:ABC-type Fe3+ transport system substrate-binding protein
MRIAIAICFATLLAVPLLFRPSEQASARAADALSLIVITPHNEQIRYEFGRGFDEWHFKTYGRHVNVIFNVPGGTSEIRKMLEAQFTAALESHSEPGGDADLVFGGGSFEHNRLKRGVRVKVNGVERDEPITGPVDFSAEFLNTVYGENRVGDDLLYDPEGYWFGTALSGFGIVFNRDLLAELQMPEPTRWTDLADSRLRGWVALVNPGQSGSITTTFDTILKRSGWIEGWQILRRAAANARYFSGSSLKPPIDVSQGSAAAGICIDFFGRYQQQALKEAGDPIRIGYVDPPGGSTIDSDPISMLRNAPHPETAKRFIEFCLSEQGQALWQFRRRTPETSGDMGPHQFELRRLPIARFMYAKQFDKLIDQVNPYELATPAAHANPNFRDFVAPLFAAMAMDNHHELKEAWQVIVTHPSFPSRGGLIARDDVADLELRQMLELFDAMPFVSGPDGQQYGLGDPAALGPVREGWLRNGWRGTGLWNPQTTPADELRRQCGSFFRANYRRIVRMAKSTPE